MKVFLLTLLFAFSAIAIQGCQSTSTLSTPSSETLKTLGKKALIYHKQYLEERIIKFSVSSKNYNHFSSKNIKKTNQYELTYYVTEHGCQGVIKVKLNPSSDIKKSSVTFYPWDHKAYYEPNFL